MVAEEALLELLSTTVCDAAGRFVRCNRRAAGLWGRTPRLGEDGELFCGSCRRRDGDGRTVSRPEIVHELATNAAKYGALSNAEGCVESAWQVRQSPTLALELSWIERGGPPVDVPQRRGFGSRLLQRGVKLEHAAS